MEKVDTCINTKDKYYNRILYKFHGNHMDDYDVISVYLFA